MATITTLGNWPPPFEVDYGTPMANSCKEDSVRPGVFHRNFTKATVEMDCSTWQGEISKFHEEREHVCVIMHSYVMQMRGAAVPKNTRARVLQWHCALPH